MWIKLTKSSMQEPFTPDFAKPMLYDVFYSHSYFFSTPNLLFGTNDL